MTRDKMIQELNKLYKDLYGMDIAYTGHYDMYTDEQLEIVYDTMLQLKKVDRSWEEKPECTCGAKHTSNPKWHMRYCPLDK